MRTARATKAVTVSQHKCPSGPYRPRCRAAKRGQEELRGSFLFLLFFLFLFCPPEEEEPMPCHALHAAHSASETSSLAWILRWMSCITRSFLSCTFLSSSSFFFFLSAAFKSQRTDVLSRPSPPASNGTERRGTPASGHRGATDNPCGSATSARGAGRTRGGRVFGPRGA